MRSEIRITAILMFLIFSLAGCTYRTLKAEMESHQPAALDFVTASPMAQKPVPSTTDEESNNAFAHIREKKREWQQLAASDAAKNAFFQPDAERLSQVRQLADNPQTTGQAISERFTLVDLELLVLLRDPAIKAAENRFHATLESYSQVAGIDEILRQYTAFTEALMVGVGPMKGKDPVQFPFPGITSLKGEVANQTAQAGWESLQITIRDRLTLARKTFWNMVFNVEAHRIAGEMVYLYGRLEKVAKSRYETGKTSFQDVIRVRIKKETLVEELKNLAEEQQTFTTRIRELLDLPSGSTIGQPRPIEGEAAPLPSPEVLTTWALQHRQELRLLAAMIGKMERMLEMAETMILPAYTLGFSRFDDAAVNQVGSGGMAPTFPTASTAGRGAGLPKQPWFRSNDAYLEQVRRQLAGLRQDLVQKQRATRSLVRESWFRLDRAHRELTLYDESVVGLSQAALDTVSRGYESGNVAFSDVIASHSTWLNANLTRARKNSDVGIHHAMLEATVGTAWPKEIHSAPPQ